MTIPQLARAVYNGPTTLRVRDHRGQTIHGWVSFTLEVSGLNGRPLESRSVYVEPFDDEQKPVILRAVIWNRDAVRSAILKRRTKAPLMPARFVAIPLVKYQAWLAKFEGITIELEFENAYPIADFVRRLRIGQEYPKNVFEKAWLARDAKYENFNKEWEYVWSQMTSALRRASPVPYYAEDYPLMQLKSRYDFEGYKATPISRTRS